jgi:hypothetical protein
VDFNYLYYRQQVELMRAASAACEASGDAHRRLATLYASMIQRRKEAARIGAY